jgi:replication factor C subunit 2/4
MMDGGIAFKKLRVDEKAVGSTLPWVEKYRPKRLDDISAQTEAVAALRACLRAGSNMPHMLFHGPAGTGKTSSILAVARELFGPDYFKTRVKELNTSDDRGISVVREKIKQFAQGSAVSVNNKTQSDGNVYPVPGFKLIVLDEADALLPDAQAALRRMMEDYSDVTRFCILCNYVSRIIDPITSRCAKFRFRALVDDALRDCVQRVADKEGITISAATVAALDRAAGGDLRRAITCLQSAVKARGKDLSQEDFTAVAGLVPDAVMAGYIAALCSGSFARMNAATSELVLQGYAASQVLLQVHSFLVSPQCTLPATRRGTLCIKVAEVDRRLFDRGDDYLQLLDLGAAFTA